MIINLKNDFSKWPSGRYAADGPDNATRFREEILVPALMAHLSVVVEIDGTLGLSSAWLEEAFGGLVSKHGFSYEVLERSLSINTNNDVDQYSINRYISDASRKFMTNQKISGFRRRILAGYIRSIKHNK